MCRRRPLRGKVLMARLGINAFSIRERPCLFLTRCAKRICEYESFPQRFQENEGLWGVHDMKDHFADQMEFNFTKGYSTE